MLIELDYEWEPVYLAENTRYIFPKEISSFMQNKYNGPAIYRWILQNTDKNEDNIIYIGEAKEFCPSKIKAYLKPGPSQKTNLRLNEIFNNRIENGYKIALEILQIKKIKIDETIYAKKNIQNKYLRRTIESILVFNYKIKGFQLLNK